MQLHIRIYGSVQGVFFRSNTHEISTRLGLRGYVRNMPDGSVEVLAEGERGLLEKLLEWCKKGPAGASVSKIGHEWKEKESGLGPFEIRY